MNLQIRYTISSDINLYERCVENTEFKLNLFGDNFDIDEYTSLKEPHKKFIVSKLEGQSAEDIGFCHFFYQGQDQYFISGGVLPKYFNSGIGLYACIAVISCMIANNPGIIVNTTVYKYNIRSMKMLFAIGFQLYNEMEEYNILKLKISQFDNKFVNQIFEKRLKYCLL